MVAKVGRRWAIAFGALSLLATAIVPGCAMVPRERIEESQRLTQSLRTENARLKDQVLGLQAQNQDYADRALDDLRRLTAQEQAIDRFEKSIHGYQDDRDRLAAAYQRLAVSLGRPSDDSAVESTSRREGPAPTTRAARPDDSPGDRRAEGLTVKDDGDEEDSGPGASTDG